jgi:hypothetical protein
VLLCKLALGHTRAVGEFRIRPPGSAIRHLNRSEELLFEAIGGMFIQLLVCLAQSRQRESECVGRLRERIE